MPIMKLLIKDILEEQKLLPKFHNQVISGPLFLKMLMNWLGNAIGVKEWEISP